MDIFSSQIAPPSASINNTRAKKERSTFPAAAAAAAAARPPARPHARQPMLNTAVEPGPLQNTDVRCTLILVLLPGAQH